MTSRWGGSVLDSVIGAFLTQNASDVLSSKAWMTLQSRFPAPRRLHQGPAGNSAADDRHDIIDWHAVRVSPTEEVRTFEILKNHQRMTMFAIHGPAFVRVLALTVPSAVLKAYSTCGMYSKHCSSSKALQKLIVVHVHEASSSHLHASACKACIIIWSSCLNHQTSSSIDWNQSHLQLHCFLSFTKDPADNMPCATTRHIIGWLEERWHDVYPMAHHHGHQWMCTSVVVYLVTCLYHLDIWTVLIQLLESC